MFAQNPRRLRRLLLLGLAAALAGCSGAGSGQRPDAPATGRMTASANAAATVESQPIAVGALSPRELSEGQCAMFLWAKQAQTRFIFFAGSDGSAVMMLNGKERSFSRTAAEGNPAFGQFTRQRFDAGGWRAALTVEVEARRGLLGGAVIPRGALRVSEPEGWERILPVAGLIACKSG